MQVKPLLKKHGFEIAFRGQSKRNPAAPGQLSDFYPVENINADRKRALRAAVNASKRSCGASSAAHGETGNEGEPREGSGKLPERN